MSQNLFLVLIYEWEMNSKIISHYMFVNNDFVVIPLYLEQKLDVKKQGILVAFGLGIPDCQ